MNRSLTDRYDKPGEECGVFGISVAPQDSFDPAGEAYLALYALQHRGQESCGIAVSEGGRIHVVKGNGLVPDVFSDRALKSLKGEMAIGHVRYSSSSESSSVNAQPVTVTHVNGSMSIACNGTLVNGALLRHEAEMRGAIFQTTNDTEVIAYMIVRERLCTPLMEQAVKRIMDYVTGAYSMVILSGSKLIAARDPNGFRPLCMGKLGESVVFASESCALDTIGARFIRDVNPGEIVVVENGQITSLQSDVKAKSSLCVFEFVYFARQDSVIDGLPVEHARQNFGRWLARRDQVEADVVIGVPDSGLSAALGYSLESGLPYTIGLVKNRYIGRTFIQTTQAKREKSVSIKLNALSSAVKGKRVILVDDSIVRGTTCAYIVSLLREAGASEVHMRVSSPPFLHPCFYGTDIPDEEVLVAHNRSVDEIAKMIGADSLRYLDLADIADVMKKLNCGFCDACFTGNHPVPVPQSAVGPAEGRIKL